MSSCGGGIGVHVQSAWHGGLSFASHHPDSGCRKTNFDKKVNVALSRPKGQNPLLSGTAASEAALGASQ